MIGLCIATGTWASLGLRAAAQMQRMTGVPCTALHRVDSNLVHPSWHKLNLIRDYPGEDLFIFDADMWCRRPWDPLDWKKSPIAMVPDLGPVQVESALYHIPAGEYYNTGLLIVTPEAKELFAVAKKVHPMYGSWVEQTSLVAHAHMMQVPITRMPGTYNTFARCGGPYPEATVVHFAGRKTVDQVAAAFDDLEKLA